jgi:putative DeoR family transcriptional regulator (stage III sporulation protein D)
LDKYIESRVMEVANYFIDKNSTVRKTAKVFGVSKSTIHKDLSERLRFVSPLLAKEINSILNRNLAERHIRGGKATRQKYRRM